MATTNKKATKVAPESGVETKKSGKKVAATTASKNTKAAAEKETTEKTAVAKKEAEKKTAVKKASKPAKKVAVNEEEVKNETSTPGAEAEEKKAKTTAAVKKGSKAKTAVAKGTREEDKASDKNVTDDAEVENQAEESDHLNEHQDKLNKALKKSKEKTRSAAKKVTIPKTNTDKARKYEPEFTRSVLDQVPQEYEGPTLRYSDNDLQEFRELITKKLESAKKELGYLQGLITRKDQMGGDESENRYMTMEDGSLSMEREQLGQMASRQITFIDHLEKALMRIENKTYGVCRVTGKLIDKARLRAVPHATLSIEAKMGRT